MIVQSATSDGKFTDITFSLARQDLERALETIEASRKSLGFESVRAVRDVAKVSIVGMAMRTRPGIAKTMFATLAEKNINIEVISTSEIKISVLIDAKHTELAVKSLHAAFGSRRQELTTFRLRRKRLRVYLSVPETAMHTQAKSKSVHEKSC